MKPLSDSFDYLCSWLESRSGRFHPSGLEGMDREGTVNHYSLPPLQQLIIANSFHSAIIQRGVRSEEWLVLRTPFPPVNELFINGHTHILTPECGLFKINSFTPQLLRMKAHGRLAHCFSTACNLVIFITKLVAKAETGVRLSFLRSGGPFFPVCKRCSKRNAFTYERKEWMTG